MTTLAVTESHNNITLAPVIRKLGLPANNSITLVNQNPNITVTNSQAQITLTSGVKLVNTSTITNLTVQPSSFRVLKVAATQGPRGTAEEWIQGAGVPSDGTGVNGDFYLNVSNGDVYEKVADTWGTSIANITGPVGPAGLSGTGILSAPGDPASGLGENDSYYRNTDDSTFWYKSGGAWACISDFDTIDGGFF